MLTADDSSVLLLRFKYEHRNVTSGLCIFQTDTDEPSEAPQSHTNRCMFVSPDGSLSTMSHDNSYFVMCSMSSTWRDVFGFVHAGPDTFCTAFLVCGGSYETCTCALCKLGECLCL